MLTFMFLAGMIIKINSSKEKFPYWLFFAIVLAAIGISLSRQAYVWTILGVTAIAITTGNIRIILYGSLALLVIVIAEPQFLMDRMDTMINARSVEDFKNLNRKVSDLAIYQFKQNLQFIPRMFYTNWEYNWSEGFWNGMLHQLGILGLVFNVYVYLYLFSRYLSLASIKEKKMKYYGLLGMILVFLMFFACFNRRSTHFMHYDGQFTQINFIILFILSYIELASYSFKLRLKEYRLI